MTDTKKQKKKILIITTTPLTSDGITKVEFDVIKYLKEDAELFLANSFGFDNAYGDILSKEGVKTYLLPKKKDLFAYYSEIKKIIIDEQIDVVYIHGNSSMMIKEVVPAKKVGAKHVITHCHNTHSDFPLFHHLVKPIFSRLKFDKVGCSELAGVWAYGSNNFEVIKNGIDANKFKFRQEKREKARKELGVDENFVIGHVGRYSKRKNQLFLIDIFVEYMKKIPDARLLLIGEGEEEENLHQKVENLGISDSVIFIKPSNHVEDYMCAMDTMIMPSLYEGLCLVALEAQANGLNLIVSSDFAEETFVTDLIHSVSLKSDIEDWILYIGPSKNREKYYDKIKGTENDLDFMMHEIKEKLLEDTCDR